MQTLFIMTEYSKYLQEAMANSTSIQLAIIKFKG